MKWSEPVNISLNTDTLYSVKPPGSGAILGLILGILNNYNFNKDSISTNASTILTYHRIIEAFKYSYAQRTLLGDADFVNVTDVSKYYKCMYIYYLRNIYLIYVQNIHRYYVI